MNNMRNMIFFYFNHIIFYNNNSILCRVYGLYTIKIEGLAPINLILMENTIAYHEQLQIRRIYDLKGSLKGRKAKQKKQKNTPSKEISSLAKLSMLNSRKLQRAKIQISKELMEEE